MKLPNASPLKTESEIVDSGRRQIVALATLALPLTLLGLNSRACAADAACFDLESLPSAQKRQRRSLGFKLAEANQPKHCGSCAFFTASGGDCGTCAMLSGGVTSTAYVCDSWAAKS